MKRSLIFFLVFSSCFSIIFGNQDGGMCQDQPIDMQTEIIASDGEHSEELAPVKEDDVDNPWKVKLEGERRENQRKRPVSELIWGIILIGAGTYAAIDGYSTVVDKEWTERVYDRTNTTTVRTDISNPGVTIERDYGAKELIISWWAHHWFTFKNTGNVTITDLDIRLTVYGLSGSIISWYDFNNKYLATNQTYGWDDWLTNCGGTEPGYTRLTYTINSYIHVYRTEYVYQDIYRYVKYQTTKQKDPVMGGAGIVAGLVGLYFVADYFLHSGSAGGMAEKQDINVRFAWDKMPQLQFIKRL